MLSTWYHRTTVRAVLPNNGRERSVEVTCQRAVLVRNIPVESRAPKRQFITQTAAPSSPTRKSPLNHEIGAPGNTIASPSTADSTANNDHRRDVRPANDRRASSRDGRAGDDTGNGEAGAASSSVKSAV